MYAVIETGGKQYRVQEGDVISVEKLNVSAGDKVTFDKVLILNDGKTVLVGTPSVDAAKVEGNVIENGKGDKVIIFKYKSKKDYRKKQGHRQPYTKIQIDGLVLDGKKLKSDKPAAKAEKPAKAEEAAPSTEDNAEKAEKKPAAKKAAKPAAEKAEKPAAKKPAAKKAAKPAEDKAEKAEKKPAAKKAAKKPADEAATEEKSE